MSGVVDAAGQQWEHCGKCCKFIKFPQNLGYEKPSKTYKYGRMLCITCVDTGIKAGEIDFEQIEPAPSWKTYEVQ